MSARGSFELVVRNATLVTSSGRRAADIAMRGGRFTAIDPPGSAPPVGAEVIDASGLLALPGLIDGHVHFREPGLEHEETWLTGTRAAVMGGVTTVLDMPNTIPPTDSVERARQKLALAHASAYCDFGLFGLLYDRPDESIATVRQGLVVGLKAFLGPTTGSLGPPHDDAIRAGLATGLRVAFHAEDEWEIESSIQGRPDRGRNMPLAHLATRTPESEEMAIDYLARLVLDTGAAGHVLHVSSVQGLEATQRWRGRGANLTSEVTPHHCLLGRDIYRKFGSVAKVNPPIRGEPHASALMAALADGGIDVLGSDHAPHLEADKRRGSIWDVPAGIPGVETLLPLMLTEVVRGRIAIERLVAVTSEAPARVWGLWPRKGSVAVGADADLTLVDLERRATVRAANLHGKNNVTPFEAWPCGGAVLATIVRGRVVMRDGELLGEPGWGRPVSRSE